MEPEKTPNSQRNVEKENQSWGHHNSRLQALLQSCNHQDSVVLLAQKQTYKTMEQNRELRNGPSTLWSTNLLKVGKSIQWEKDRLFKKWCWGKLDSHMQKNETGPFSYTIHKNRLKMNELKGETGFHQNPRGEHRKQPL